MAIYYKTTKRNGMSFHGNVKYAVGKTVRKRKSLNPQLCTSTVLHASAKAIDALSYAGMLDCNLYEVEGQPVVEADCKSGFFSLTVIREIPDSEKEQVFGFSYNEALHPVDPSWIENEVSAQDLANLKIWDSVWASVRASVGASVWDSVRDSVGASVRDSVGASVWDSVWASVWASVRASVGDSVCASVGDSVWDSVWDSVRASVWASVRDSVWASVRASVRDSVWDSVRDSVWAYVGSLFPYIVKWQHIEHAKGIYPFQPAVDLWKRGFIPIRIDGTWKLYHPVKGKPAICVYEGEGVR